MKMIKKIMVIPQLALLLVLSLSAPNCFADLPPWMLGLQNPQNGNQPGSPLSGASQQNAMQGILAKIESETASILAVVNRLPTLINNISLMAVSWTTTNDPNNVIANLATDPHGNFTSLNDNYNAFNAAQLALTQSLTLKFLIAGSQDPTNPSLPINTNSLYYGVLQGVLLLPPPPPRGLAGFVNNNQNKKSMLTAAQQLFIQNLSGSSIVFPQAKKNWKESPMKTQYINMYQTTTAIASFNTYLLTSLLSQQDQDSIRKNLLTEATNSNWFTSIASEPLGLVLRQILVYASQEYVQMDRLIKIQQQQLQAQAVANTLLNIQTNSMLTQNLTNAINQQAASDSSVGIND